MFLWSNWWNKFIKSIILSNNLINLKLLACVYSRITFQTSYNIAYKFTSHLNKQATKNTVLKAHENFFRQDNFEKKSLRGLPDARSSPLLVVPGLRHVGVADQLSLGVDFYRFKINIFWSWYAIRWHSEKSVRSGQRHVRVVDRLLIVSKKISRCKIGILGAKYSIRRQTDGPFHACWAWPD